MRKNDIIEFAFYLPVLNEGGKKKAEKLNGERKDRESKIGRQVRSLKQ